MPAAGHGDPSPGGVGRARADDAGEAALMSVTRRAHPTGNVTWRAKVFFEGRVIAQRSFGRRVDAKRWEADQLAKLDAGSWIDPARGRMTFAALAEERQASRGHLAVRSQETTRFLLDKYVIPEIGAYPISGITAADVERVMSALTTRGLATATRRRALSMMRLVFDYAIRDRRLSVNVARMVALPRGGTKREPHWLRPEQLGRLVMAVPPLCQPVVLFLGTTGCRFSEMAALRVDDVVQTPHGLGVRVHRAATQSKRTSGAVFGPTKTHQTRTVPVPAALDEYVRTRVAFTAPGGYLFPSPAGGVWTNTNFRARPGWMEATRHAGVEGTTIHDLGHTAASLLIAAGADVKAVQVILGHSTATMTMDLYGHLFSEATWQAMERLPVIPLMRAPRGIASAGDAP
ncbi:site-specific integrase [Cellulomonas sp.]|uniref:tyrosine-type recombinase/integrase n=1 Tax=Cellulomonas sp. TaxID=40001 RepID=UPI002583D78C|nr:site-specific integrase [Cellulomonas sp.]MCR6688112.1 site-specific integrase [Cellulomonas sp.]